MQILKDTFSQRLQEIDDYLNLLSAIEKHVRDGKINNQGIVVTTAQLRILYSSVHLQLYNLVEATISKMLEIICETISQDEYLPKDLSLALRKEWIRHLIRTQTDMNPQNRLEGSLNMCEHIIKNLPIKITEIKRNDGNWDDEKIYQLAERLGWPLQISEAANRAAKEPISDELGALALIVNRRNKLAHGDLSFGECGSDLTVAELMTLRENTVMYLQEVVSSFIGFIDSYAFLQPRSRPYKKDGTPKKRSIKAKKTSK
jgi:hypothetical protein